LSVPAPCVSHRRCARRLASVRRPHDHYERRAEPVELKIEGKADSAGSVLFGFDLTYAGVFRIQNVPQENMHPLVMIECPRLLFPFAREIVATAVRDGGFPPLLIDPIDFVALYRQKMGELQPPPPTATA